MYDLSEIKGEFLFLSLFGRPSGDNGRIILNKSKTKLTCVLELFRKHQLYLHLAVQKLTEVKTHTIVLNFIFHSKMYFFK